MKKENYIFDCTDDLNLTKAQTEQFSFLAEQLSNIRNRDSRILEIYIGGGYILDALLNLSPYDIDIRYFIVDDDKNIDTSCRCSYIKQLAEQTAFTDQHRLDFGNTMELNHAAYPSVKQNILGTFSYHTEFISMFALDTNARIWANRDSIEHFKKELYESRPEGLMAYQGNLSYYQTIAIHIIRGLGYLCKRDLEPGEKFRRYLLHSEVIFEKVLGEDFDHTGLIKYFYKKVDSFEKLESVLTKKDVSNKKEVLNTLLQYTGRDRMNNDSHGPCPHLTSLSHETMNS